MFGCLVVCIFIHIYIDRFSYLVIYVKEKFVLFFMDKYRKDNE